MNQALIVVDVQNDFCPPYGALAVPDGQAVVGVINYLSSHFGAVVTTQDWHPANHCSFQAQGGPWPVHCVANTEGAALHGSLDVQASHQVLKGTTAEKDAYSGFDGTDLADWLHTQGIDTVFVTGLATDYCVKATALDALKAGFKTYVVTDACRGVDVHPGDAENAFKEMMEAGAQLIHSADIGPQS